MKSLYQPIDSKYLAVFRILLGLWMTVDMIGLNVTGWVSDAYVTAPMNFSYVGFEWVKPLPSFWMHVWLAGLALLSLSIMLGLFYRIAVPLFFVGYLYVFLIDQIYYLNKFYLFLIFVFWLNFLPAHKRWSLDVWIKPKIQQNFIPTWQLLFLQFHFFIVYFYAGIAKLNPDWLFKAEPLRTFFGFKNYFHWLGEDVFEFLIYTFSYGGLLFDLSIVFLLWFKKTRKWGHIWQITFHSLNGIILQIGTLSWFMIVLTLLLFPPDCLKERLAIKSTQSTDNQRFTFKKPNWLFAFIVVYAVLQLLIPHRHYLTGKNVNWTEKGHRFSWRLMTRTKAGCQVYFIVKSPSQNKEWKVNARKKLSWRHYRKMAADTDLIIAFGHFLGKKYKMDGYDDVEVYAVSKGRVNGRPFQPMISLDEDLLKLEREIIFDSVTLPLKE